MSIPPVELPYLLEFLTGLLNTPSPTGYADNAIQFTANAFARFPNMTITHTRKGALLITLPGKNQDAPRLLSAHADTLGAMVKEIKPSGRLKLSKIGSYAWNTVEGEGCHVLTNNEKSIRGSLLINTASGHVHSQKVTETKREDENMEVRLDARAANPQETRALGIEIGDFVAFDPRVEVTNGFVRSRHLDDKASVACILAAVKALHQASLQPEQLTYILIANYEEVGHGAAGIPQDVAEMLVVDMAAVGEGQNSDEFHTSLCVKDSGGPYHHGLNQRLRKLAAENQIDYRADIYPYYASDGTAFWRTGADVAVALIGPGVDASHNYERTHSDALLATTQWILAYLLN